MKIADLLAQAALCHTQDDADALLETLRIAFAESPKLRTFEYTNPDAYLSGALPVVELELNRIISDWYITVIRPSIDRDEFAVDIITSFVKDGLGMQSHHWTEVEDLDDCLTPTNSTTVDEVLEHIQKVVIKHHRVLLARAGLSAAAADHAAQAAWPQQP